jgi:hypothetical protein
VTGLMYRLARANSPGAFMTVLAVTLAVLFVPGPAGGALLLLMLAATAALTAVTWRIQPPATRVGRLAVLAALALIAVIKITH